MPFYSLEKRVSLDAYLEDYALEELAGRDGQLHALQDGMFSPGILFRKRIQELIGGIETKDMASSLSFVSGAVVRN